MINVISHDPGGAELLSSWIANNTSKNYIYSLKGPAQNIFKRKIKNLNRFSSKKKFDYKKVIITTGSDYERKMIFKSYKQKKYLIVVLDHWINYKKRLLIKNIQILPNEIWVFDRKAEIISKKIFKCKITRKKNFYYANNKKFFLKNKKKKKNNLLFICDPNPSKLKKTDSFINFFDEKKVIKYILSFFLNDFICAKKVILRLHPSQLKRLKYWKNYYKKKFFKFKNKIYFTKNNYLAKDLINVKMVFGGNSAALNLSSFLGIKTYSISIKKKTNYKFNLIPNNKKMNFINIK